MVATLFIEFQSLALCEVAPKIAEKLNSSWDWKFRAEVVDSRMGSK